MLENHAFGNHAFGLTSQNKSMRLCCFCEDVDALGLNLNGNLCVWIEFRLKSCVWIELSKRKYAFGRSLIQHMLLDGM